MLIRSQNKENIKNLNLISEISLVHSNENWEIIVSYPHNGTISPIGSYSTKQKAMKVLDNICSFASGIHFEKVVPNHCGALYGVVFQMPQDDEVK